MWNTQSHYFRMQMHELCRGYIVAYNLTDDESTMKFRHECLVYLPIVLPVPARPVHMGGSYGRINSDTHAGSQPSGKPNQSMRHPVRSGASSMGRVSPELLPLMIHQTFSFGQMLP